MTEPLRNYGDHGGDTAVYVVQAPQGHRASGVTGVLGALANNSHYSCRPAVFWHDVLGLHCVSV